MDSRWWNGDVDDWPSVEDADCPDCGAHPDEACEPECECDYCRRKAARADQRQRLLEMELQD